MPPVAKWRGEPEATTYAEAVQVFKLAKLSKKDVFYDLGCGYGRVCIWAARRCRYAIGIENHGSIVREANKKIQKSGLINVRIVKGDFERLRFPDANLLYCITELDLDNFRRWNMRKRQRNLRIVTLGPPPIPIKPVASRGLFYLTKFPYSFAGTGEEWCCMVLGKESGTRKDVEKGFKGKLSDDAVHIYGRDFKKYFE